MLCRVICSFLVLTVSLSARVDCRSNDIFCFALQFVLCGINFVVLVEGVNVVCLGSYEPLYFFPSFEIQWCGGFDLLGRM